MLALNVEEECLVAALGPGGRERVLECLRSGMDGYEGDMRELAERLVRKLEAAGDAEFGALVVEPAWDGE